MGKSSLERYTCDLCSHRTEVEAWKEPPPEWVEFSIDGADKHRWVCPACVAAIVRQHHRGRTFGDPQP